MDETVLCRIEASVIDQRTPGSTPGNTRCAGFDSVDTVGQVNNAVPGNRRVLCVGSLVGSVADTSPVDAIALGKPVDFVSGRNDCAGEVDTGGERQGCRLVGAVPKVRVNLSRFE